MAERVGCESIGGQHVTDGPCPYCDILALRTTNAKLTRERDAAIQLLKDERDPEYPARLLVELRELKVRVKEENDAENDALRAQNAGLVAALGMARTVINVTSGKLCLECGHFVHLTSCRANNFLAADLPIRAADVMRQMVEALEVGRDGLKSWLDSQDCDCAVPGHICGRPARENDVQQIESALTALRELTEGR